MKRSALALVFATLAPLYTSSSTAAVFTVTSSPQFQAALTAAATNGQADQINVAAGVYATSANGNAPFTYSSVENFDLVIDGASMTTVFLDGDNLRSVLSLQQVGPASLLMVRDLTIRNAAHTGAAVTGSALRMSNSGFTAVVEVTVTGTTITANGNVEGGAVHLQGGTGCEVHTSVFSGNQVTENGPGNLFGAVISVNSPGGVVFAGNQISQNMVTESGAGQLLGGVILLVSGGDDVSVTGTSFTGNTVSEADDGSVSGGVLLASGDVGVLAQLVSFTGTSVAESGAGDIEGGVLYISDNLSGAGAVLDRAEIRNTVVSEADGGGIVAAVGEIAGNGTASEVQLIRSIIEDVTVTEAGSGAVGRGTIYVSASGTTASALVLGNIMRDISMTEAGGLIESGGLVVQATTALVFTNAVGNIDVTSPIVIAGGMNLTTTGDLHFNYNSVWDVDVNAPTLTAGGASLTSGTGLLSIYNNIVWGNTTPDLHIGPAGTLAIFNNDYRTLTNAGGTVPSAGGNVNVDPLMVSDFDFHLTLASPVRDAGTAAAPFGISQDIDGEPRIIGPAPDMGADEYPVAAGNAPPIAVDDPAAAAGDPIVINVLINDSDPEMGPLTVPSFTQPAHGVVSCTLAGACTYTPAGPFVGLDTFTYTVSDASAQTDIGTVLVTRTAPAIQIPTAGEWSLLILASILALSGLIAVRPR